MSNKEKLSDLEQIFYLLSKSMDNVDEEIKACHELNISPEKYYKIHNDIEPLIDNARETAQQIINRLGGLAHYKLPEPRKPII